jgi:putative ABC transport system permease protein
MGSSIRALARVGWRDIRRQRGRSILIVLLILLPVAAMVAGISLYRTTRVSESMQDTSRMGSADLLAFVRDESELEPFLPAGSTVERVTQLEGHLVLDGARPSIQLRAMNLDGIATGMLNLIEGRKPQGESEVAITPAMAKLAGVGLGGTLTLEDRPPATVVGLVENPIYLSDRSAVIDPATADIPDDAFASFLIDLPPGADPLAVVGSTYQPDGEVQEIAIEARSAEMLTPADQTSPTIVIVGALALVEASLIASAAFAVSIRRRQRELGLLSATGATPRQLAGTVVAEAAILGAMACVAGVAVGLLGVLALTPWLDQLTEHRNGPLVVDAFGVLGPVTVGFIASLVAAIVPAVTVARVPVLLALSRRRPSQAPARRTLWRGIAGIAISVVMTVAGATTRDSGGAVLLPLMVGGAVLGTLGFGACSPWLLERLEGIAGRLPVAGRIAFRDTARARSRSSPIVTAVLSSLAAAIALGAFTATRDAESIAGWRPGLHPDQVVMRGAGAAAAGEDLLGEPGVAAAARVPGLWAGDQDRWFMYTFPDARDADGKLINTLAQCENCNPDAFSAYQVSFVSAATPELLQLAHAEDGAADLEAGRAILLTADPITVTKLEIVVLDSETSDVIGSVTVPARAIDVGVRGGYLPEAFLPQSTVSELKLVEPPSGFADLGGQGVVVQYDHDVTGADLAAAQAVAARYVDTFALTDLASERPGEGFRFVLIALVLLFAVSVTAIAIALGEAESRPEQRSLLALGADPRLRRRIAASRAAVLALLAGLLAVPAGLLPMWGIFTSRGSDLAIPTLEIAGAVLVLPILAVASAWLLSRPIPEWNAFRNVRTGE